MSKAETKKKPEKARAKRAVKSPTVLQMEAVECGAASLAMILRYYGRYVSLEELRTVCDVSRDGVKASNMLKGAREYGLKAKGFKKEPEALRTLTPPFIVHWNFNHFLVVDGFKGNKVKLNDPAVGPRTVTMDEFDQAFTGVALVMEPGPDFEKGGQKPSVVKALARNLTGSRMGLVYLILTGVLLAVPGLAVPTFSRIFIDEVLVKGNGPWLKPLVLAMVIAAFITGILTWLQQYYLMRMETKLSLNMTGKYIWHVFRLPIEFFFQRYAGDIADRVNLNQRVAGLVSGQLATTIVNLITVGLYALVMFQYSVALTLVGIGLILIDLIAYSFTARVNRDANQRQLQEAGKLGGIANSGLKSIETIKASGSDDDFFSKWAGHYAKSTNSETTVATLGNYMSIVTGFTSSLNTAVILGLGGLQVIQGIISIGELIAFRMLMGSFTGPFKNIIGMAGQMQSVESSIIRLDDVYNYNIDPQTIEDEDLEAAWPKPRLGGHVELKNLTFGYNRLSPPLIENFNLVVEPGRRIALVGGSGSGKSTVAKMVSGLYQPWSGEVLFDGNERKDIPRSVVNNSLAVVDQDIFMFDGTLKENLTMWDDTIAEDNIVRAAKDAEIHDVVAARPGAYDSKVSEGGHNFSGGQRQRLDIARALVTNPTILIMDEATSALDPTTEKQIDENIRRRGCTCLIIAHRLSTIRDSDEIIVLDHGKVVQRGTHKEMIKVNGPYARLIAAETENKEALEKQPDTVPA